MKRLSGPARFLFFIPLFALGVFAFGGIVMLLWNNVLTPVLHVSAVTFWQGLGILVLSKILFSSFGGRGGPRRGYWKQRMMWDSMTPEQKEKFKEECRNRSNSWGKRTWGAATGAEQQDSGV